MAKGRKTGGRDFKPGQSGNPAGMAPLPPDVKEARALTRIEFERIVNRFIGMTKEELSKSTQDPKATALELLIASILHKGVVMGDQRRLEFVLDRLIGKVPERISGPNGEPLNTNPVVVVIPSNGREAKKDN